MSNIYDMFNTPEYKAEFKKIQDVDRTSDGSTRKPTDKMVSYAKVIVEYLELPEPNWESFTSVSDFLKVNVPIYNQRPATDKMVVSAFEFAYLYSLPEPDYANFKEVQEFLTRVIPRYNEQFVHQRGKYIQAAVRERASHAILARNSPLPYSATGIAERGDQIDYHNYERDLDTFEIMTGIPMRDYDNPERDDLNIEDFFERTGIGNPFI